MSIESAMKALEQPQNPATEVKQEEKPKDIETQSDAPKEEAPKEEPDIKSQRFAELSRKEQRIRLKQQKLEEDLKAREAALVQKEQEIRAKAEAELIELFNKNPKEAFKRLKTDYNRVTEAVLSDGKPTVERLQANVEERFGSIDEKIESKAKEIAQKAIEEYESKAKEQENARILQNFSASIVEEVKKNADKFPATAAFEASSVIENMIRMRYEQTNGGHWMKFDEAAELLEKELVSRIEKVTKHPSYASRFSSQPQKESVKPNNLNKPKTITNEMTADAPLMVHRSSIQDDAFKRALAKLQ